MTCILWPRAPASIFSFSDSDLLLPSYKDPWEFSGGARGYSRIIFHHNLLTPVKSPLPWKVLDLQILGIKLEHLKGPLFGLVTDECVQYFDPLILFLGIHSMDAITCHFTWIDGYSLHFYATKRLEITYIFMHREILNHVISLN